MEAEKFCYTATTGDWDQIYYLLLDEFYEFLPQPFSEMPLSERQSEDVDLIWVDFVSMMTDALQITDDSDQTCFLIAA